MRNPMRKNVITDKQKKEYYQALIDKQIDYEGIFFVGVKTTEVC